MSRLIVAIVLATRLGIEVVLGQMAGAQVLFNNKAVGFGAQVRDASGALLTGSYVAELFYSTNSDPSTFTGLDTTIDPFYAAGSPKAGFWNGGTVAKHFPTNVVQGVQLYVQVRVWDTRYFTNWAEAENEANALFPNPSNLPQDTTFQMGSSYVFTYTPPLDSNLASPTALLLAGLEGFSLSAYTTPILCPPPPVWTPFVVATCDEDSPGVLIPARPNGAGAEPGDIYLSTPIGPVPGGVLSQTTNGIIMFTPLPHTQGSNSIPMCFVGLCGEVICGSATIVTRPSPKRPYLVASSGTNGIPSFALRGLAGRRYRIDRAADLRFWETFGGFTANQSELILSNIVYSPPTMEFVRAVDITESRPYLVVSLGAGGVPSFSLRGIESRRYRIELSHNLRDWVSLVFLVASSNEDDIPQATARGYYRAIDVTP